MLFAHELEFDPLAPEPAWSQTPARAAVFCLRGETGEPYLNWTQNLRSRLGKLLTSAPAQTKRLQLAKLVRKIAWAETASDFSARWLLYRATRAAFGDRASAKLHLRTPFFLRVGMRNRYPRVWVTNSIAPQAAEDLFGPFPSRQSAERYAEQVLDLHLLRRCFQDLAPDPEFPGCIYSEMQKCLAPCYGGCPDERYGEEAATVHAFLSTRGASLLQTLAAERASASEALDFEAAARSHARFTKVEQVADAAPELAGALAAQHGVVVQPSIEPDQVDLFLVRGGALAGPAPFSLLGMQLPDEHSGSTSLFAHPAALRPTPLDGRQATTPPSPEERLGQALERLASEHSGQAKQVLCDHQALLARWYFRPQAKREGELMLATAGQIPLKSLLRACARVFRARIEREAAAQQLSTVP